MAQKSLLAVVVAAMLFVSDAGLGIAADLPLPLAPKMKQEKAAPAKQPTEFEKLGADCVEAFDGCRRFTRAGDGKFDAANNIGIACQPKPLTCSKRR